MSKHAELLARLEAAEVGSRELDAELWDIEDDRPRHSLDGDFPAYKQDPEDSVAFDSPPPYTTSLDTALALAERVLPSMLVENLGEMRDAGSLTGQWLCQLSPRGPRRRLQGPITAESVQATLDADAPVSAKTPALALCIAILQALKAKA